jgi:uncharacterized membrane protein
MTGTIIELALAAIVFVGSHIAISSTWLRADLVGRLGERAYLGLYSAVSLILLAWLIRAYGAAGTVRLWWTPPWLIVLPLVVMPFALLFVVCGLTQRNPTAAGATGLGTGDSRPAPGIFAVTRHPVLWGIGLWAIVHFLVNGDLASIILFGSLAFLALYGTHLIDAKKQRTWPAADWQRFSAATSNLPFAALASSRNEFRILEIGWWRLMLTGLLYIALVLLHGPVLGTPVVVG